MKIVIMDGHAVNPGDLTWDMFREYGEVVVYERTLTDEVVPRAKDADAVFTNKVVFDATVLRQLPQLKYIGVLATGTNVVDLAAARQQGIIVTNIPAYSTASVAQIVFAHLLNVLNSVDRYATQVRQLRWSSNPDFCYWDGQIHEVAAMTMGIVGLGHIGMQVAAIAHAFGMPVLAYTSKEQSALPSYIKKVAIEELYSSVDVLSLHCPLTAATQGMINASSLALMRPTMILINTGRGPLVDEAAVARALHERRLMAYCADVMCHEPPESDNPLFACENAFITPHLAWGTIEARRRLLAIAHANVEAFVQGAPINVV